jgi:hypothetical protein
MRELYDARPCSDRAVFLREQAEKGLQESLCHLFDATQEVAPLLRPAIKEKLRKLKQAEWISSFHFLVNSLLFKYAELEQFGHIESITQAFIGLESIPQDFKTMRYRTPHIPKFLWDVFDPVSLYDFPKGSYNAPPLLPDYLTAQKKLEEALHAIAVNCPDLWQELRVLIREIVLLESNRTISGSSFDLLGLVYFRTDPALKTLDFLDFLVHEGAHQYIFNLSSFDPLCLNDAHEKYSSPLRKDLRPMMGIYHATFVTARLLYVFQAFKSRQVTLGFPEVIEEKIIYYKEKYKEGFETLMQHGKLTELGEKLILSTRDIYP